MQGRRRGISRGVYVFFGLFLVTYLIFPSLYVAVSQKLFTFWYARHAHFYSDVSDISSVGHVTVLDGEVPLYVIARPPQTPYDLLLVKAPDARGVQDISHYVYHGKSVPVGYVAGKYSSVYAVALFSAPQSREQFSVGEYVAVGVGQGGGSFSLQVPAAVSVSVDMPIIHQATGSVVGFVVAVEDLPEKNIQKVSGVLAISPFQMAVLYAFPGAEDELVANRSVERAVEMLEQVADEDVGVSGYELSAGEENVGGVGSDDVLEDGPAVESAAFSREIEHADASASSVEEDGLGEQAGVVENGPQIFAPGDEVVFDPVVP